MWVGDLLTIRCVPDFRIRSAPRRSRREHRYGRARPRMPPPGHVAPAWRLGDARTYWPPHALRPHRSLQVRIEESPAGRSGGATFQGRRHGDRNGRRRGLAGGPDSGGPSSASSSGSATDLSRRVLATGYTSPRSWISARRLSGVTSIVASVTGSPKRRRPALPGFR